MKSVAFAIVLLLATSAFVNTQIIGNLDGNPLLSETSIDELTSGVHSNGTTLSLDFDHRNNKAAINGDGSVMVSNRVIAKKHILNMRCPLFQWGG